MSVSSNRTSVLPDHLSSLAFQCIRVSIYGYFYFLKPLPNSSYSFTVPAGIYNPSSAKSSLNLYLNIPITCLLFWKPDFLHYTIWLFCFLSIALLITTPTGGKGVCHASLLLSGYSLFPLKTLSLGLFDQNYAIHCPSWLLSTTNLQVIITTHSQLFSSNSLPPLYSTTSVFILKLKSIHNWSFQYHYCHFLDFSPSTLSQSLIP